MPITVRQLQAATRGRILLGHQCTPAEGWQRWVDVLGAPDDVLDRTIADLYRAGRWKCGACGGRPAVMVYVYDGSTNRQIERWADDEL